MHGQEMNAAQVRLSELGLSIRTLNPLVRSYEQRRRVSRFEALSQAQVGEYLAWTPERLMELRGFGRKGLAEFEAALARFDLRLPS